MARLTWEKFDKLYTDLLTYCMVDDERLRLETLEASVCLRLPEHLSMLDASNI